MGWFRPTQVCAVIRRSLLVYKHNLNLLDVMVSAQCRSPDIYVDVARQELLDVNVIKRFIFRQFSENELECLSVANILEYH